MTIKIGQLQTFINVGSQDGAIKFGVENTINKYAPFLGETLDFHNSRKVANESWFEAVERLHLTELFYNEQTGLFKNDRDITPLTKEHLSTINHAYDLYFETYPECKPTTYSAIGIDGRLSKALPTRENYIAADIMWLRFWANYAGHYCSKPVISNVEYLYV